MKDLMILETSEGYSNSGSSNSKAKGFRLNAKSLFLTYPKCTMDLRGVFVTLANRLQKYKALDWVFRRELHEDGSPHVHVYLRFQRKVNITNASFLDLGNGEFHGNYQAAKSEKDVLEYVLKDLDSKYDKRVLIYSPSLEARISAYGDLLSLEQAALSLAQQGDVDAAMELYRLNDPKAYLWRFISLERTLRAIALKSMGFTSKYRWSNYEIPSDLEAAFVEARDSKKTLFIKGASGSGKTQMLLSFFDHMKLNPLRVTHPDGIRNFVAGHHKVIFYDDMNWSDMDRESLLSYLDVENVNTLDVKHTSMQIPGDIHRFAASNKSLESYIGNVLRNDPALKRRVVEHNIPDGTSLIKKPLEDELLIIKNNEEKKI